MTETFGIKVSQPGYDATTAAKENLVFSSEYDTLKLFDSGSGTIEVPGDNKGTVQITHSLGYKPAFLVFSDNPLWATSGKFSAYTWRAIGGGLSEPNYATDNTKLYLTFYNPGLDSVTFTYHYHIYYNKIA